MRVLRARTVAAVLGAMLMLPLVTSCALLESPAPEPTKAVLNKMPAEVPQRAMQAGVLVVFPPQTQAVYDTTRMAYSVKPYEVAYFARHEWGETPAQMLQPLLIGTLQETRAFAAVLASPYPGRYNYALRTEIRELIADFSAEPAALQLSLRFVLSEGGAGRVLATREVSIREPLQEKSPYGNVVAANNATAKALLELAKFVLEKASSPAASS